MASYRRFPLCRATRGRTSSARIVAESCVVGALAFLAAWLINTQNDFADTVQLQIFDGGDSVLGTRRAGKCTLGSALSLTVAPPRDFELSELGAKVRGTAVGEYFALVPRLTRLRRSTHTSIHMSLRAHV